MKSFTALKKWALVALIGLAWGVHANAQGAGCTIDRTLKGQQAWRLVLRYGTPEQLSILVNKGCIDPNVGVEMSLPSALSFVANRTMLNQAIALGWRPLDELTRDANSNRGFINPLIRRMVQLPQDHPSADMEPLADMLGQRYGLTIELHDHRSDAQEEDTLLAIADLLPIDSLATVSPILGVNVMTIAASGKHERLVQALLDRRLSWTTTYVPYPKSGTRGMWDVVMDDNTCVQRARALIPGAAVTGKALEQKQITLLTSLQKMGFNPLSTATMSAVVPGLTLNIATQEALWLSPENWAVMRQQIPVDKAYVSEGTANDIRDFLKKSGKSNDYNTLMGPALPENVCTMVLGL